MKKSLLVFSSLLLLFSCSKENLSSVSADNGAEEELARQSYNVTYDDAVNRALNAPELFKTTQTKSGAKKIGKCLPILSGALTKGGSVDTLVYLVNYTDGQGYAFIPKDGRKGDYLAYVEKGNFNLADTATDDLIKYLYRSIVAYCKADVPETKGSNATYDGAYLQYQGDFVDKTGAGCSRLGTANMYYNTKPLSTDRIPKPADYYYTKGCSATLYGSEFGLNQGVDPLLTTSWGQGYPFNERAPLIGGKRAIAGCVATAITQVVVYHSFPLTYPANSIVDGSDVSGDRTNVQLLRKYRYVDEYGNGPGFRDYSSRMYRYVGDAMNNSWGVSSTGAYTADAPICFRKLGYTSAPSMINYDNIALRESLDNNWPVIIRGSDSNGGGGHAWVIDGYRYLHTGYAQFYFDENGNLDYKSGIRSAPSIPSLYVSCNFGWNGSANGFYLDNVFNTSKPFIETKYNFVGTQIIVNIHP